MTLPSFFRSCAELPLPPASSIAGGTYIVTGSNTGLGVTTRYAWITVNRPTRASGG
ncbi:hypothetical protein CGMCC3_g14890 [Colletotrichum fructicola]|nr:uncharacterized protein CGMCC3_g14890 [Colletotrichum fructicola]KAE9568925.1 hypothetical protein CGMCC3_g14890 [Colletotrichum fructicola]